MSASRTLLRQHKLAGMERNADGELVKRHRIKPGSPDRRILSTRVIDGREHRYHATKGLRVGRP